MTAQYTHISFPSVIRTIILALFLVICTRSFAQFDVENKTYGMKLGLNYSLNGLEYNSFNGSTLPSVGVFYSHHFVYTPRPAISKLAILNSMYDVGRKVLSYTSATAELAYNGIRFRETQSDTRYKFDYLDANLLMKIYTSSDNKDFSFILGAKPYYLIDHGTEAFQTGTYLRITDSTNRNKNGTIHVAGIIGLGVQLSPIVELELSYIHSFENKSKPGNIQGRPSTLEFGLRINAVNIKKQFSKGVEDTKNKLIRYKQGVLLVMLSTPNEAELKSLESQQKWSEIALIKNEISSRNNKIYRAFSNEFKFCPVYFYYDSNAYKVMRHELNGIFLNPQLLPDASISIPDTQSYFIASFCEDNSNYTGRNHFGLYVYDNQINQLEKPFNSPSQLISMVLEGDPLNYVKRKRTNYAAIEFKKYVYKFNLRLFKAMQAD
ncbi:MAG: hypothetical protein ACK5GX_08045 [Bacteroidota bacterium]